VTVTLQWWMLVPAVIVAFWSIAIVLAEDRDMVGFSVLACLAMTVPALLVAWLT
jgi:hypothetical protein